MAEIIRRIEEKDFEAVSELYNGRKSVDELKWLFKDPENPDSYNAFVSQNNNIINGAIGYSSSTYKLNKLEFEGVIFMSWIVSKNYKGFAGISLLKKISQLGDFAIAIAGSELGQSFYPMLKYQYISKSDIYYKVIKFSNFYNSIKRKSFIKTIGMIGLLIPSYFKNSSNNDISLIPYNGDNYFKEKKYKNVFSKKITKNYINWLLACPTLKTYGFNIKKENENLGICVLYIKKTNKSTKGRIVYLPFLGYEVEVWSGVISKCLKFFREEGCTLVSGLAHHKMSHLGFKKSGFSKIKGYNKPNYIKDHNKYLETTDLNNWHLQFSEGDKGYRGI